MPLYNVPPFLKGHEAVIVSVQFIKEGIQSCCGHGHASFLKGRPQLVPLQSPVAVSINGPEEGQKLRFGMVNK
jgi:hypothetical protein